MLSKLYYLITVCSYLYIGGCNALTYKMHTQKLWPKIIDSHYIIKSISINFRHRLGFHNSLNQKAEKSLQIYIYHINILYECFCTSLFGIKKVPSLASKSSSMNLPPLSLTNLENSLIRFPGWLPSSFQFYQNCHLNIFSMSIKLNW